MAIIQVKTLTGQITQIEVDLEKTTVGQFKVIIEGKIGKPVAMQRLVFAGKALDDDSKTLSEHGVGADSVIHLVRKPEELKTRVGSTPSKYIPSGDLGATILGLIGGVVGGAVGTLGHCIYKAYSNSNLSTSIGACFLEKFTPTVAIGFAVTGAIVCAAYSHMKGDKSEGASL